VDKFTRHASRRGVMQAGYALLATFVADNASAQDAQKATQSLVQYRSRPNGAAMCRTCINFEAPNACKAVAGTIDPNGWCLLFAPKPG
jgi:hypothetical protein